MAVFAGSDFTVLYNAGYASILGDRHPWAFGRTAEEVWSSAWPRVTSVLRCVSEQGRATRVRFLEESGDAGWSRSAQWVRSLSPIPEGDGGVVGVLEVLEARARSVSVTLLREREARQRFFLRLTDRLRPLSCPRAIQSAAAEALGRSFGIGLAGFLELGNDGEMIVAGGEYQEAGLPVAPQGLGFGGGSLKELGDFGVAMRDGRDWFVEASSSMPYLAVNSRLALGPGESVAVLPISRQGKVVGALYVLRKQCHRNPALERALLREVAERTWMAVERARLDAVTRATEERLRAFETLSRSEEALRHENARLVELNRCKSEFLGILSHELRNTLGPLRNGLYILAHAEEGAEQAQRARGVLSRKLDQLGRLVDDLLDVTRISRNKISLHCQSVELNEFVCHTLDDYRPCYEEAGVRLEYRPHASPVWISADAHRLAQIIGNLLHNAVKFTSAGGLVRVTVTAQDATSQALICVADSGLGLTSESVSRLFEPFVQAAVTVGATHGGLGLGLALVKGLTERHGGTVEARSEGLGHGSEFILRFPLDNSTEVVEERSPESGDRRHRRVLVIEDNADAADTLREALEINGHVVAVAYDGVEGLAKAREFHAEVVLCDLALPGMNGFDVARALRKDEELGGSHLVALSGLARAEDKSRAREAGFDQHVAKPPSLEQLEDILAHAPDFRR
jgi:signal transduction histidine kinase/ActR/RegA family two-component response regulator